MGNYIKNGLFDQFLLGGRSSTSKSKLNHEKECLSFSQTGANNKIISREKPRF